MAKAIKPKTEKVKETGTVVETPKEEVVETPVAETPDESTVEKAPTEPVVEETKVEEPVVEKKEEKPVVVTPVPETELSMEQKILNFLEDKTGEVRMNDFLKSLFGVPMYNEPPKWANQGASKLMRSTLQNLVQNHSVSILNDLHMRLGTFYYPDSTTGKTEYHNLNTVSIIVRK